MERYATLHLIDEVTVSGELNLNISDEDLKFVHDLRKAAFAQQKEKLSMARAIQARYALLHPLPLHVFKIEYDDHADETHIIEERNLVDDKKQVLTVAKVNNEMRRDYAHSTKKAVLPGHAGDELVANWWINLCKNAMLDNPIKSGVNPQPAIRILRRGTTSADFSFKTGRRYATWTDVRNVPVDMKAFRKQAANQGFKEKQHAAYMIRQTRQTWAKLLEPENSKMDLDKESGLYLPRKGKEAYFKPGWNVAWEKYDGNTIKKFHNDPQFRRQVEESIARVLSKITGVYVHIPNDDEKLSHDDSYNFDIPNNEFNNKFVSRSLLITIMNKSRQYILATSGHGDLSDNNFLYKQAINGVMNNVRKFYPKSYVSSDQSTDNTQQQNYSKPQPPPVAKPQFFKQGAGEGDIDKLTFGKYVNKRDAALSNNSIT